MNDSTWKWVWDNSVNAAGYYGEKGVPTLFNMPGARAGAVGWFDSSSQELWLFGGYGYDEQDPGVSTF